MKRLTKLDKVGLPLNPAAAEWDAVLDNETGLIWSAKYVLPKRLAWKKTAGICEKLTLCGQRDWRRPTIEELFTLPDRELFDPALDKNFFPDVGKFDICWSSSPLASSPAVYAWFVPFCDGHAFYDGQDLTAFVRAVRSARASQ